MIARLIFLFFILLFSKSIQAQNQDNLIGLGKKTVDSVMNANHSKFNTSSVATDTKLSVITFTNVDGSVSIIYYDKDDICYQSAALYKTNDVDAIHNIINKNFDKHDEKTWIRKDNKVKAEILILKGVVVIKYLKT